MHYDTPLIYFSFAEKTNFFSKHLKQVSKATDFVPEQTIFFFMKKSSKASKAVSKATDFVPEQTIFFFMKKYACND